MCDKHNRTITYFFCGDLHLTQSFLVFYKKTCLTWGWSLAEKLFKQNNCHPCHTRFAVFFPLPSCCVSSVLNLCWMGVTIQTKLLSFGSSFTCYYCLVCLSGYWVYEKDPVVRQFTWCILAFSIFQNQIWNLLYFSTSLCNRRFMSQARRTRHFVRKRETTVRASRKMLRLPRLAHKAPVMLTWYQALFIYLFIYLFCFFASLAREGKK